MKVILEATALLSLSGIGRYTYEIAHRLPMQENISEVLLYSRGRFMPASVEPIRHSSEPSGINKIGRLLLGNSQTVRLHQKFSAYRDAKVLKGFGQYIFHSPNFSLPKFPGRSVVTIHDLSIFKFPENHPVSRVKYLQAEIPKALEQADFIITDSEFTREEIVDYFGYDKAKVKAIPLGVSDNYRPRTYEYLHGNLEKLGLTPGKYCLCVSTIEPRKNILRLLNAWGRQSEEFKKKWPLVLAGGSGWNSKKLHALINALHARKEVIYLEFVSENILPDLYAGARAFFFPSIYEGFGLPVIEAMASGVPVMCSDNSSLPEVTKGSAWLVPPEDEDAISEGIQKVVLDESWREKAINSGINISKTYSWNSTVENIVNIYRSLDA